jgi:hypothetical protein
MFATKILIPRFIGFGLLCFLENFPFLVRVFVSLFDLSDDGNTSSALSIASASAINRALSNREGMYPSRSNLAHHLTGRAHSKISSSLLLLNLSSSVAPGNFDNDLFIFVTAATSFLKVISFGFLIARRIQSFRASESPRLCVGR